MNKWQKIEKCILLLVEACAPVTTLSILSYYFYLNKETYFCCIHGVQEKECWPTSRYSLCCKLFPCQVSFSLLFWALVGIWQYFLCMYLRCSKNVCSCINTGKPYANRCVWDRCLLYARIGRFYSHVYSQEMKGRHIEHNILQAHRT